ncbi:large subunit ribosomal protein L22e [Nematocida sp. AWRm77]|nr:large subunit ribosomal protein L22e [Nematocida sp. AWRm77]
MTRRKIHPILEKRKEVAIDCKEAVSDRIFDLEECANFIRDNNKLTKHTQETLPEGPIKVTVSKADSKILLDIGVSFQRRYVKKVFKHYLARAGLKDWIYIRSDLASGNYTVSYYNTEE